MKGKTMQTQQQEKIENFKKYVWSFYGTDEGIYKDFFGNNLKMKEVERAVQIRLSNMEIEFAGDSIDREIVRDIIYKMRDPKAQVEHNFKFKI
jgi:hypothetical protein